MSRVRVTLNYIDIADAINDIKRAKPEELNNRIDDLENLLDSATKEDTAKFLKAESVRFAFYEYNKKIINAGISLWTWPFNLFTPAYSHVEIGIKLYGKWVYFSSTLRDGAKGTRWIESEDLFKNPERWDIYEISVDSDEEIESRASDIAGLPYDWAGIGGFTLPIGVLNNKDKWYCSEAVYYVLTGKWIKRISPRKFYSYLRKKYGHSLERIQNEKRKS
ncbi:MAG: hypothetical protein KAJ18_11870 [Candidatus Omnitrophica bacterium]|nr:hypothetical protein [Candidatus Omnitrophota bacterium]